MLNVMGAIFVSVMFLGTSNSSTVQPVFAIERAVMYRYISRCPCPASSFAFYTVSLLLGS